jgi:isochorismate hydrolase
MVFGKKKNPDIYDLIKWNPVDLDPSEQQLPSELIAFMQNYDKDVVKNLYGQEVIDYINNLRQYRRRAKENKVKFDYTADEYLKDNRWYKDNKVK